MAGERLYIVDAAARIGIAPSTFNRYRHRRWMNVPHPDGEDESGRPWWFAETIDNWHAARPGMGWRSDLLGPPARTS